MIRGLFLNYNHHFIIRFLGFRPDLLSSEIPASIETNSAFCTTVIQKYKNSEQAKNLFTYSKKSPVEFSVMLMKGLILKDESIIEQDQFEEWLEKYGEYIV